MGLNGLSEKSVRRIARQAGIAPDNVLRATVLSHAGHWLVWLTLKGHFHAVYDRRSGELELLPTGRPVCTSLCRELFPGGFA
jgi:hypothetical protein